MDNATKSAAAPIILTLFVVIMYYVHATQLTFGLCAVGWDPTS